MNRYEVKPKVLSLIVPLDAIHRPMLLEESQRLASRALRLTFAVFGLLNSGENERVVRVGGSVFISPYLAVTAEHVPRGLIQELDWRGQNPPIRPGYFTPDHTTNLFQVLDLTPRPRIPHATWAVDRTWTGPLTDIALMQVSAENGAAHEIQLRWPEFFPWSLLPPPIGAEVAIIGYPSTIVTIRGEAMQANCNVILTPGRVSEIYEIRRDRGMIRFPSFRIDVPVDHGCSGGPVIYDNHICGIVSAGCTEDETIAASMWPFTLLEYEYPDQGILGLPRLVGELIDSGTVMAPGWTDIRDRISRRTDEDERPYAHIE